MRSYYMYLLLSAFLLSGKNLAAQGPYEIQLSVFDQPIPNEYFGDMADIRIARDQNDFYRVYQGSYETESEAIVARDAAKSKGYSYATVVDIGALNKYCAAACRANLYVENIFFDFDRYDLRAESRADLADLSTLLFENPEYSVILTAHTDSKGSNEYNNHLSQNRADSASNYLLKQGVKQDRIKIDYQGESDPIARNESTGGADSPSGRQFNRRVEVTLLGPDGKEIPNVVKDIEVPANLRF